MTDAPRRTRRPVIGVMAVQGDFREHMETLDAVGAVGREVRLPGDLDGVDGLVVVEHLEDRRGVVAGSGHSTMIGVTGQRHLQSMLDVDFEQAETRARRHRTLPGALKGGPHNHERPDHCRDQ